VRRVSAWLAVRDNQRDVVGLVGAILLWIGLDRVLPGTGMAATGAVLIAIAVLVR